MKTFTFITKHTNIFLSFNYRKFGLGFDIEKYSNHFNITIKLFQLALYINA